MTTAYFKTNTTLTGKQYIPGRATNNTGKKGRANNKKTWWRKFLEYSANQQANRFGWLGLSITLQGCVMAPLTLCAIVFTGNSLILWMLCMLSFAVTEVVNLAAMPTRITIPVLFGGIVLDILVIAASFISYTS